MQRAVLFAMAFAAVLTLALTLATPSKGSEQNSDPVHAMGVKICTQMLDGTLGEGFHPRYYRERLAAGHLQRDAFCQCVGSTFADDPDDRFGLFSATGDAEAAAMTAKITDALETCNAMDGDLVDMDSPTDPYNLDGDLPDYVPADTRLAVDESGYEMCRMFVDDATLIPGFTSQIVNERLQRTGQSATDLCSCSARKMSAKAKQLEKEIEDAPNPSVVYASTLGGVIHSCLK